MKKEYLLSDGEVRTIVRELKIAQDSISDLAEARRLANIISKLENGGKGFHYTTKDNSPNRPLAGAARA